jgi:hypothetical protein
MVATREYKDVKNGCIGYARCAIQANDIALIS